MRPSEFGQPLHCIDAPGLYDLTPCAPDGGWGLSAGTGLAGLTSVTGSWVQAHDHFYGKFYALVSADSIVAAASFGEGLPSMSGEGNTFWRMEVSRITGEGRVRAEDGTYGIFCQAEQRKF